MSYHPWMDRQSLRNLCQHYYEAGRTIGMTAGCFDILHVGHLRLFQALRQKCSIVVVGINTDTSVRRLKGDGRPINPERERADMVLGLKSVCLVALIEEDTPDALIRVVQPSLYMKGGDYDVATLPERATVEACGGIVLPGPMVQGRSTTALAGRLSGLNRT
jgi:rfaE bifunctional protein nucleotidyltransferase chain/domain